MLLGGKPSQLPREAENSRYTSSHTCPSFEVESSSAGKHPNRWEETPLAHLLIGNPGSPTHQPLSRLVAWGLLWEHLRHPPTTGEKLIMLYQKAGPGWLGSEKKN